MFDKSKPKFGMRGQFTPENSALVLVDYQVGTLQLIRSSSADVSLRNAVMLAKAAVTLKMPIVLTLKSGGSHPRCDRTCVAERSPGRVQGTCTACGHRKRMGGPELQRSGGSDGQKEPHHGWSHHRHMPCLP